jgi:RNA polymerase sigma-70 factor (ECF subfamily)
MARQGSAEAKADLELVERLRQGRMEALEALMERYESRVYRLALGITRNEADAEEVVQDVFLTVFRKIQTFDGRAAFGSWIYRVTVNAALMKRRGKHPELEVPLEDRLPQFRPDGHYRDLQAITDWSGTPEDRLLEGEARILLNRAIDRLPPHYRAVLVLRDLEGLSNEEAAEILEESVASVKSRLHRARMVLREELSEYFGTAGKGARPGR